MEQAAEHVAGDHTVRVVVFEEEGWKVAQCLEYDIAVQAKTYQDLYYQIEKALVGQMVAAMEDHRAPFENLPEAPAAYHEMWERAAFEMRLRDQGLAHYEASSAPPTLILRAA